MPHPSEDSGPEASSLTNRIRREELLDRFEAAWQTGARPSLADYLAGIDGPRRDSLLRELLPLDCLYRRRAGEQPVVGDYAAYWPHAPDELAAIVQNAEAPPHAPQDSRAGATGPAQPALPWGSTANITGRTLGPNILLEKLGQGGMGAVYKARHQHLDKLVAVKVLPPLLSEQPELIARFKREMKAVGKIDHPHIVRAMDAGEIDGVHYLTMEYVEGSDLAELVKAQGPLSVSKACQAIRHAALALAAAHQAGLVHRDVKPSNLLVSKSGEVKLLDLGLARLGEDAAAGTAMTVAGQAFGTPDYMAPEQWADTHAADARADLYALGCTLFFLLTGRAPYGDEQHRHPLNKMSGHCREPIPDLKTLRAETPDGVAVIYRKLMAKNPDERFQTATELLAALTDLASEQSGSSPSTSEAQLSGASADHQSRFVHRARRLRYLVPAVIAATALIGGAAFVLPRRQTTEPPAAPQPSGAVPSWPFDPDDGRTYVWSGPEHLGPWVNSEEPDVIWGLSEDERTIYFARDRLFASHRTAKHEMFADASSHNLVEALDQSGTISQDGLLVVGSKQDDSQPEALWVSERASHEEAFGEPVRMPAPVNGDGATFHPVLSPDGLTLLACSTREGRQSGDIWMFTRTSRDAPFADAAALPEPVNSADRDMPAFINSERTFLIASTQRKEGTKTVRTFRYFTRAAADVAFLPPQPIELPLGAAADDAGNSGYRLSADGRSLYVNSVNYGQANQSEMYVFRRVPE